MLSKQEPNTLQLPLIKRTASMSQHTTEVTTNESLEETRISPSPNAIAALAYQFWILRAHPGGSPEFDWFRTAEELKSAAMAVR
jgi:hypothetical protein